MLHLVIRMKSKIVPIFCCLYFSCLSFGQDNESTLPDKKIIRKYEYVDRDHTSRQNAFNLGFIWGLEIPAYILTQRKTIKEHGSWDHYKHNFGRLTADHDEPIWNLVGHPVTGSQTYLYYRAKGYNKLQSLHMSFWSSFLFEFTIETYTERPSIQDLYQTPVLGSVLGYGLERLSMALLNSDTGWFGKSMGYLVNPMLFFGYTEIETIIYPEITSNRQSLNLLVSY